MRIGCTDKEKLNKRHNIFFFALENRIYICAVIFSNVHQMGSFGEDCNSWQNDLKIKTLKNRPFTKAKT